jgi:hypothetical protein
MRPPMIDKATLKKFCVYYNARKDPVTRNKLLEWMRMKSAYIAKIDSIRLDVSTYITKFNSDVSNAEKVDYNDREEITVLVAKAFEYIMP